MTSLPGSTAGSRPSRESTASRRWSRVELYDGALHRLASLSAEPGYGFLTLVPQADDGEPQELIVPLGAVRQLRLSRAEPEPRIGFSLLPEPAQS